MLELKIRTENAAFADPYTGEYDKQCEAIEICRILRNVIKHLEDGCTYGACYDINGNKVGYWKR